MLLSSQYLWKISLGVLNHRNARLVPLNDSYHVTSEGRAGSSRACFKASRIMGEKDVYLFSLESGKSGRWRDLKFQKFGWP